MASLLIHSLIDTDKEGPKLFNKEVIGCLFVCFTILSLNGSIDPAQIVEIFFHGLGMVLR